MIESTGELQVAPEECEDVVPPTSDRPLVATFLGTVIVLYAIIGFALYMAVAALL